MKEIRNSDRQREVVRKIIKDLTQEHMDMYYNSTSDTANEIYKYIQNGEKLNQEEKELVGGLSARDISLLLSLNT